MSKRTKKSGFTLIEVLASLMIFSAAILTLVQSGTASARTVQALQLKTHAGIIADNQLILARAGQVVAGTQTGMDHIAGRDYAFVLQTLPTDIAGFYRLEIKVRSNGEQQVLVQRTAFTGVGS